MGITKGKDKPLEWMGSSKKDMSALPADVKMVMGYALRLAQQGEEHPSVKALKGFGGRGVLEVIEDFETDTYRGVYTVKFASVVYVLHAFQKKSKKGVATTKQDIELIKSRLKEAESHYKINHSKQRKEGK